MFRNTKPFPRDLSPSIPKIGSVSEGSLFQRRTKSQELIENDYDIIEERVQSIHLEEDRLNTLYLGGKNKNDGFAEKSIKFMSVEKILNR